MKDAYSETPNSRLARAVEVEFGQPFWQVVRGFADDGESIKSVSELLGYKSHSSFFRLLDKFDMRHLFSEHYTQSNSWKAAFSASKSHPNTLAAMRRNLGVAHKLAIERAGFKFQGVLATENGHAKRCGIRVETARYRLRMGYAPEVAFNPSINLTRPVFKNNSEHHWRKYESNNIAVWREKNEQRQHKHRTC